MSVDSWYDVAVMRPNIHVTTRVLPGGRIEIVSPELKEGDAVEVTVRPSSGARNAKGGVLDFLNSLPPGPRSAKSWEELERELKQERDSWDR
ncbi:MAG: hypothetical protein H7Z14_07480 [Anaerolineae bacterium]|nr:hypothetical protein [Phycisphaerae bacterium]